MLIKKFDMVQINFKIKGLLVQEFGNLKWNIKIELLITTSYLILAAYGSNEDIYIEYKDNEFRSPEVKKKVMHII